jgi:predicted kinase
MTPFVSGWTSIDSLKQNEKLGSESMKNKQTAYVMVGVPGSGKSTYAAKLAQTENAVIISGDDVRAELYGSSEIQGGWGEIWERIDELVSEAGGVPVILDGTHCRKDYRAEAFALLKSYGYERIEAIVMETTLATCLARNFKRDRNVPDYIVKQMHSDLQQSLKTITDENFDSFNFIY